MTLTLTSTLIAIFCIVLGFSFAYKAVRAMFWGKMYYWQGFLPFTIVSPLFIHWPPSKNSLIHDVHSWWVHIIPGPIFMLLAFGLVIDGVDRLGLPGSETMNYALTLGHHDMPPALLHSRSSGRYNSPMLEEAGEVLFERVTTKMPEDAKRSVTPTSNYAAH